VAAFSASKFIYSQGANAGPRPHTWARTQYQSGPTSTAGLQRRWYRGVKILRGLEALMRRSSRPAFVHRVPSSPPIPPPTANRKRRESTGTAQSARAQNGNSGETLALATGPLPAFAGSRRIRAERATGAAVCLACFGITTFQKQSKQAAARRRHVWPTRFTWCRACQGGSGGGPVNFLTATKLRLQRLPTYDPQTEIRGIPASTLARRIRRLGSGGTWATFSSRLRRRSMKQAGAVFQRA